MRLTLTTDDGEVMDTEDITYDEFRNLTSVGAKMLLHGMHSWDETGTH